MDIVSLRTFRRTKPTSDKINLLNLPLETICNILCFLTPHETSQFAITSKYSTRIFKFDIKRILTQIINEWAVFIFVCPRCEKAFRNGTQMVSKILVGTPPKEQVHQTCRSCYLQLRKETVKRLGLLLIEYRKDRDHETEQRRLAYEGICRYQSSSKHPRKKDLDFLQNIVKKIYVE